MTLTCILSTWACTCNMFKSTMVVFAIQATTDLSIQPPQLEFLLEDFTRKLSHSLIAATSKRKSFLKVGTPCGVDGGGDSSCMGFGNCYQDRKGLLFTLSADKSRVEFGEINFVL